MKAKVNKTYINQAIQLVILTLTVIFLYDELFRKHNLSSIIETISDSYQTEGFVFKVALLLLLVPVQWWLEGIKWKFLIGKLEQVSAINAFRAVLTGISVSIFLPNRTGDYLGRVFILKKADRLQATLSTILGGLAQLITTILFGLTGLAIALHTFFDLSDSFELWSYIGIVSAVVIAMALIIFFYLNFSVLSAIIKNLSGKEYPHIKKYSQVFQWYDGKELFYVLLMSMLRYLIFSFQFYLSLRLFNVGISYVNAMVLISVIYLFMTVIPTVAMTELGVRGSVSLYVFAYYFEPLHQWTEVVQQGVVAASSLLWIINIGLPALAGAFFVFQLRFFRNNNHANGH